MVSIHCPAGCQAGLNKRNLIATRNSLILKCVACETVFKLVMVKKGAGKEAVFTPEMSDLSYDGEDTIVSYKPKKAYFGKQPAPIGSDGNVAPESLTASEEGLTTSSAPPGAD